MIYLLVLCMLSIAESASDSDWTIGTTIRYPGDATDIGEDEFNTLFRSSLPYIIRRECESCEPSYKVIYYRRLTSANTWNAYRNMRSDWRSENNQLNQDFILTTDLDAAIAGENEFSFCNYDDPGIGSFRDCGINGYIAFQWTSVNRGGHGARFSIYTPVTDHVVEPVEQTPPDYDLATIGETCTLSMGNDKTIAAATGLGIDIIGQLVGLIPVFGPFGSAAISFAKDPAVDAIQQAINDGAIICEEGLWCCNKQCQQLQTDWARVQYCPHECKAGALCPSGSCGRSKAEYASCSFGCHEECASNMKCCDGQCRYLQRDWAGIDYCPHECNGGCGWGGTCPSHRSRGQSCSCALQCNSGCCDGGRCVDKKRDWANILYCPGICRGGPFKGPGTC